MNTQLCRARPWLGTLVEIRAAAAGEVRARRALESAFAEVEAVHRRMSFHERDSDLSMLHAAPVGTAVGVDPRTVAVLRFALELAERSDGCFDPSIAGNLVAHGFLPPPRSPFVPDAQASWRDVEVLDDKRVRLRRPLWLDLGGIAKGYAVDRAVAALLAAGAEQVCVNAGGDVRVAGPREEVVHLRGADGASVAGAVAIRDAALASSAGAATRRWHDGRWTGAHLDGRSGKPVGQFQSVSMLASTCLAADALTKVAFAASPVLARRVFAHYGAEVVVHEADPGRSAQGRAA